MISRPSDCRLLLLLLLVLIVITLLGSTTFVSKTEAFQQYHYYSKLTIQHGRCFHTTKRKNLERGTASSSNFKSQQQQLLLLLLQLEEKSSRQQQSRVIILSASKDDDKNDNEKIDNSNNNHNPSFPITSWIMISLPFVSLGFPLLLNWVRSFPVNSVEQFTAVTLLFVTNRAYLYSMSATIVALAALRGANDSIVGLGQRIINLTEELLYTPTLRKTKATTTISTESQSSAVQTAKAVEPEKKPTLIRNLEESGVGTSLDQVSSETQAIVLPLVVSALLASSVFFLGIWKGGGGPLDDSSTIFSIDDVAIVAQIKALLSQYLPNLTQLWNAALLTLFTKTELRRLQFEIFQQNNDTSNDTNKEEDSFVPIPLIWAMAIGITGVAFFGLPGATATTVCWPAQNFVNMALAITVARAIQLDRFPAIVAALTLLTLYDASSVLFFIQPASAAAADTVATVAATTTIPAAAAAAAATTTTTLDPVAATSTTLLSAAAVGDAVSSSAMGSVAMQKLTSSTFQPGLLTTKIGRNLGGALGLGDAVFPAILAIFVRRYDEYKRNSNNNNNNNNNNDDDDTTNTTTGVSFLTVAIGGYLAGCVACEFAPAISSSGLPALIFIIPSMLGSVVFTAALRNELAELWSFQPGGGEQEQ